MKMRHFNRLPADIVLIYFTDNTLCVKCLIVLSTYNIVICPCHVIRVLTKIFQSTALEKTKIQKTDIIVFTESGSTFFDK